MEETKLYSRLSELLKTFNTPDDKKTDYLWLNKNVHIKNENHRDLAEVKSLISEILKIKAKERTRHLNRF